MLNVTGILIDSSSEPHMEAQLEEEISSADSIIVLYDLTRKETAQRVLSYWMPLITKRNQGANVIIAGNKLDLTKEEEFEEVYEETNINKFLKSIMREYSSVEIGLECSVKEMTNTVQLVYCAQRVVLFPLGPLMDAKSKVKTMGGKLIGSRSLKQNTERHWPTFLGSWTRTMTGILRMRTYTTWS